MTIPPEAGAVALLAQAVLLLLPHVLRKRRTEAPQPAETERQLRVRLSAEIAEVEAAKIGMPDNWREYADRAAASYLRSEQGRIMLDEQIKHRVRSMLTGVLLSCAGIRIDEPKLAAIRDEVIEHVRDALQP